MLAAIREGLRAFVGQTAFEALSQQWVAGQGQTGGLPFGLPSGQPFEPQEVGSHWSRQVQVDVAAVNWRQKAILLGECKWGAEPVERPVIRELIEEKTPKVLAVLPDQGEGWSVYHAFFARAGFTHAARALAEEHGALLVGLERLDQEA